jgi:hypothetical protein
VTPLGQFQRCPELHHSSSCGKLPPDAIMKAKLYAQFNPTKTMSQLINDRALYRLLMVCGVFCAWCI